jgi:predicted transcriptional regulator of viral defense system
MKFGFLLSLVADEAVFSSGLLLSGSEDARQVRLQLSRWVKSGQLFQLRRGLYALAPPWRKVDPHPFLIANRMRSGSYVSLQSALAWHGVIPEQVPVVTSVGPGRAETANTPLGVFRVQHIAEALRFGYSRVEVAPRQFAFVAVPEKALLDLVHLTPGGDTGEFLRELRLQNPAAFQPAALDDLARRSGKPKLVRAARRIASLLDEEEGARL